MNKAIIIFGSSRSDGNTKIAIDALNFDNSIPVVDLNELQISPYDYEHKNQNDDYLGLMEKILNYDSIILASPVYWYTMSAQMKVFIDRLSDCLRIRKDIGRGLAGKSLYLLGSYAGAAGDFESAFRGTCKYMNMTYGGCFLHYSGTDPAMLKQNDKISEFRNSIGSGVDKQ